MKKQALNLILLSLMVLGVIIQSVTIPNAKATTLFSDGFESGDFSAWTSTSVDGGTATVQSPINHSGSYAAKFDITTPGATSAGAIKIFSSTYSTAYAMAYVYFEELLTTDGYIARTLQLRNGLDSVQNNTVAIGIQQISGVTQWWFFWRTTSGWFNETIDSPLPQINTWYSIEVEAVKSATVGEVRGWVNGVEYFTKTGLNTGTSQIDRVVLGRSQNPYYTDVGTTYGDCVTVSDTYILPEEGQAPSVLVSGKTSIIASSSCKFYAEWETLSGNMSYYIFGTDNTGSWVNETATAFVPADQTQGWSNVTKTLTSQIGATVQWQVWANNTLDFWASTGLLSFITTASDVNKVFETSWEDLTSVPSHTYSQNFYVQNIAPNPPLASVPLYFLVSESNATYNYGWLDPNQENRLSGVGGSPYYGSKTIGLQTASTRRIQLVIGPTALTTLGLANQIYISEWIYLPSDFSVQESTWGYTYMMFQISGLWSSNALPYFQFMIRDHHNGLFDLILDSRDTSFNEHYYATVTNFALPLGEWFNLAWFQTMSTSNGRVVTWLNGQKLWDVSGLQTKVSGYGYMTQFGKIYHAPSTFLYEQWLDDVEFWTDIPEGGDTTPPTYTDIGVTTTYAGNSTTFYANWTDNVELSGFIFGTNNTGTWVNETWAAFSTMPQWSNVTKTLTSTVGAKVNYAFWVNDTSDNWAAVASSFITTSSVIPIVEIWLTNANPVSAQDGRVDLGTQAQVGFWFRWNNGTEIDFETAYINGTATSYAFFAYTPLMAYWTVGKRVWTITTFEVDGIEQSFQMLVPNPEITWDKLMVTFSASDTTPDQGDNVFISWVITRQSDNSAVSSFTIGLFKNAELWGVFDNGYSRNDVEFGDVVNIYDVSYVVDNGYNLEGFDSVSVTVSWGALSIPLVPFPTDLQFLGEGDLLGFLQAIYVLAFASADIFYALVAMLVMGAIYIRTHSLILMGILWLLVGGVLIVALPLVAGLGVFFIILGVASLLFQLFKPNSPSY